MEMLRPDPLRPGCFRSADHIGVGDRVAVRHGGGMTEYSGTITKAHKKGTFSVTFDDGDAESGVAAEAVRALPASEEAGFRAGGGVASAGTGGVLGGARVLLGGVLPMANAGTGGGRGACGDSTKKYPCCSYHMWLGATFASVIIVFVGLLLIMKEQPAAIDADGDGKIDAAELAANIDAIEERLKWLKLGLLFVFVGFIFFFISFNILCACCLCKLCSFCCPCFGKSRGVVPAVR